MLNQTDPWRYHRNLGRVPKIALPFFLLVPVFVFLGILGLDSDIFHFLVCSWALLVLVMLVMTHEARCPRCGQRFYAKGLDFLANDQNLPSLRVPEVR